MRKINEALRKHSLVANRYEKRGKATIVNTNEGRYIYKNSKIDDNILNYLKSRNFDYLPEIIGKEEDYQISKYVDGFDIPNEQKMLDLVKLVALLHSKTTHYKEIDINDYEEIYEDLDNNLKFLYGYYTDLITTIESKVYMSPSELLLARNISKIYQVIEKDKERLEKWHEQVKEKRKQRNVVLHNNLKLDHFIRNNNSYLISWDKAKIGNPVFDLYKLYNNHILDFDFSDILREYEKSYPLLKDEKELFYVLISLPDIIKFQDTEYNMCKKISHTLDKIYKTERIISPEESKKWTEKQKKNEEKH